MIIVKDLKIQKNNSGLIYTNSNEQIGLYPIWYIDYLINNKNYIPIATPQEFSNIRTGTSLTMGFGTVWEDLYTTGLDKKYILVKPLDFSSFGSFSTITSAFLGTLDGNKLPITNVYVANGSGLFNSGGSECVIRNFDLSGDFNSSTTPIGMICGTYFGKVEDSKFSGTVFGLTEVGGICGTLSTGGKVINCSFNGSVSGLSAVGGLVGGMVASKVSMCYVNADIICADKAGGIASTVADTNCYIDRCFVEGQLTGTATGTYFGGVSGRLYGQASNIVSAFNINNINGSNKGGLVGRLQTGGNVINCYSYGTVSAGSDSYVGGLIGRNYGTVTNSYYDTTVTGLSDTGKGEPKTTTELKQGLIPDTSVFVGWNPNTWDAVDNLSYPILK